MEDGKEEIMPVLNIKDAEAYRLASHIAEITGKSLTRVVLDALRAESERVRPPAPDLAKARAILSKVNQLPVFDNRSGEMIRR
jgi:hypothetical protein